MKAKFVSPAHIPNFISVLLLGSNQHCTEWVRSHCKFCISSPLLTLYPFFCRVQLALYWVGQKSLHILYLQPIYLTLYPFFCRGPTSIILCKSEVIAYFVSLAHILNFISVLLHESNQHYTEWVRSSYINGEGLKRRIYFFCMWSVRTSSNAYKYHKWYKWH